MISKRSKEFFLALIASLMYDDKQQWFDDIKQMAGTLGYATDNKAYKQNPEAFQSFKRFRFILC